MRVTFITLFILLFYEKIWFPGGGSCNYFHNLVLRRLVYPGSKLKTTDYFTSEAKTLIPVVETFQKKFNIDKPIIEADAALLSQKNINALQENHYEYILGRRLQNETKAIKSKIIKLGVEKEKPRELKSRNGRLIVSYSQKRAHNDRINLEKGLTRLEKSSEMEN